MSEARIDRQEPGLRLMAMEGGGSAIVEGLLALSGQRYTINDLTWEQLGPGVDPGLCAVNPLGQVPALVTARDGVLTETVAIALYLDDQTPRAGILPERADQRRPQYLRWLVFLSAAIYPTFTFGDSPPRWVSDRCAQLDLKARTDAHRESCWRMVEDALEKPPLEGRPFVLGERPSALDVFLAVMSHWQPRRPWFESNCPRIAAIAAAADQAPSLAPVMQRNFANA